MSSTLRPALVVISKHRGMLCGADETKNFPFSICCLPWTSHSLRRQPPTLQPYALTGVEALPVTARQPRQCPPLPSISANVWKTAAADIQLNLLEGITSRGFSVNDARVAQTSQIQLVSSQMAQTLLYAILAQQPHRLAATSALKRRVLSVCKTLQK